MTAVVHFDAEGELTFYATHDTVLYIVDERAPHDRVYQYTADATEEQIRLIIGSSDIGSSQDERHAAVSARVLALIDGNPHLKPVDPAP